MKIARFLHEGAPKYGIVDEGELGDELVVLKGDPLFAGFEPTGERVAFDGATLLAPVIPRSKVVGIGKNYAKHAAEMGGEVPREPLIFFTPNTAVIGPGDTIRLPAASSRVEHEGELAIVIGKVAKNVAAADYADVIFGYTAANDVTARDIQAAEGQWSRAKGFDTFCPLGPAIETDFDWSDAAIEVRVDGELRQQGTTADMVFQIPQLIEFVTSVCTLLPGDVILTGTPDGIGPFVAGQTVSVSIDGIGTLSNPAAR